LAPQVKQRVFDGRETLAKTLILNGLLKLVVCPSMDNTMSVHRRGLRVSAAAYSRSLPVK
jgi:hypothetical protein